MRLPVCVCSQIVIKYMHVYARFCGFIERGLRMLLLRFRSSVLLALGRLYWELQSGIDEQGRLSIRPDLLMADVCIALGLTGKYDLRAVFGVPHLPGGDE